MSLLSLCINISIDRFLFSDCTWWIWSWFTWSTVWWPGYCTRCAKWFPRHFNLQPPTTKKNPPVIHRKAIRILLLCCENSGDNVGVINRFRNTKFWSSCTPLCTYFYYSSFIHCCIIRKRFITINDVVYYSYIYISYTSNLMYVFF